MGGRGAELLGGTQSCSGEVTEGLEGCEVLNNASFRIYQLQFIRKRMFMVYIYVLCVYRGPLFVQNITLVSRFLHIYFL